MSVYFTQGHIEDSDDPRDGKRVVQLHLSLGGDHRWRDLLRVGPFYLTLQAPFLSRVGNVS